MLFQLENPVLTYSQANRTLWLLLISTIPQTIIASSIWALVVDISLFTLAIIAFVFPQKRSINILFSVVLTLYVLIFSLYNAHFNHSFVGLLFTSYLLCFSEKAFETGKDLLRYYTCFIISSAGLWKIFRGHVFNFDQFTNIIQHQFGIDLLQNSDRYHIHSYFINNPTVAYVFFIFIVVVQISFLVGFFTKRYDKWLGVLFILFFIGDFLIMQLPFIEIYPLLLTFIEKDTIARVFNKITFTKPQIIN